MRTGENKVVWYNFEWFGSEAISGDFHLIDSMHGIEAIGTYESSYKWVSAGIDDREIDLCEHVDIEYLHIFGDELADLIDRVAQYEDRFYHGYNLSTYLLSYYETNVSECIFNQSGDRYGEWVIMLDGIGYSFGDWLDKIKDLRSMNNV